MKLLPMLETTAPALLLGLIGLAVSSMPALGVQATASAGLLADAPSLQETVAFARNQSDLRVAIDRYALDRAALMRRYDVENSPALMARLREFYGEWTARLRQLDFDALNHEGKVDYVLLRNRLTFELAMLDEQEQAAQQMAVLIPYAGTIQTLQERRRDREPIDARAAAQALADLAGHADSMAATLRASAAANGLATLPGVTRVVAFRAANHLESLRSTLARWYGFFAGYDPLFTWWVEQPYARADSAIASHIVTIRRDVVGIRGDGMDPIIGDPIGAAGLEAHLVHEMIPYSAEELLAIGQAELAWCEARLLEASREMGFGNDWKAAQEAVKEMAVAPGEKANVVRDLAAQSLAFIEARNAITIPPLAEEIWRMEMMSPDDQRINPFFRGGETITISYPTNTMSHDEKRMSMRGNNPHFNRATVHHELIPGHHLQAFMADRFNAHRNVFNTPFWREGWALYWELQLWDQDFPRGPEDRIGMLFWRMHRAARIIFSLSFHLGRMTPEEAVDFLVDRVGHERANAEAEVRRSFQSTYSPLYQAAYMLGGMQFRALHEELVTTGKMSERAFHDTILRAGVMPVEMVRALLTEQPITRNYEATWRFVMEPLTGR